MKLNPGMSRGGTGVRISNSDPMIGVIPPDDELVDLIYRIATCASVLRELKNTHCKIGSNDQ